MKFVELSRQPTQVQLFAHIESPPEISTFWTAFKACTTPIEANQVIQLPTNVYILGNPNLGSSVFIRHCYPRLLASALSIVETPGSPHLVILGNPGMARPTLDMFSCCILLALVPQSCMKVEKQIADISFLRMESSRESGMILLVTWIKPAPSTLWMHVNLFMLQQRPFFSHLSVVMFGTNSVMIIAIFVTCRYGVAGRLSSVVVYCLIIYCLLTSNLFMENGVRIPRYVLGNANTPFQQSKLNSAIRAVDLDLLVKAFGNPEASDSVTHLLLHLNVADDFGTIHYSFASEYVADQVYLQLYTRKRDELIQFLSVSQGVGD